MINCLLHRKNLVKTSATPGKTQLINFFIINNDFYFVDLPGYGYANVPKAVTDSWAPMIEGYLKNSHDLAAVVVLLDSRRTQDERDKRLLAWLQEYAIPFIVVLTKSDKLNRRESEGARKSVQEFLGSAEPILLTSAKNGQGMKELWGAIIKAMKCIAS